MRYVCMEHCFLHSVYVFDPPSKHCMACKVNFELHYDKKKTGNTCSNGHKS